jgi:alkaline phosphatase
MDLEDLTTRSHTRNPVPLAAWGPGAAEFVAGVDAIDGVAPALHEWLVERRARLV